MTTETLTLADFLLARIAEDEARASATRTFPVIHPDKHVEWIITDPHRRLLAECEAKRRIVERCESLLAVAGWWEYDAVEILRALAVSYDGHPDYDESLRP